MSHGLLLPILFGLLVSAAPGARAADSAARPVAAWKDSRGGLLVEMDPQGFASDNRYFWSRSGGTLQQLEVRWEDSLDGGRRIVAIEGGRLTLAREAAGDLSCASATSADSSQARSLLPLAQEDVEAIATRIASGKLAIKGLPRHLETLFVFELAKRPGELVQVLAPRYDFDGTYEVRVGRPGKMKSFKSAPTKATASQDSVIELIQFQNGGSAFLPLRIDLLPRADKRNGRTSPFLVRAPGSPVEKLILPREPRSAAVRALLGSSSIHPRVSLPNPCAP